MRLYEIEEIEEIDKLRYARLVIVNIFLKKTCQTTIGININMVYNDISQYNIYIIGYNIK